MGWGAYFQFGKGNGQWTDKEKDLHINNLELLFSLTFKLFKINFLGKHVRIMSDSATEFAYINHIRSTRCHKIAK